MRMRYFLEKCALHQRFPNAGLSYNVPTRPIFSNASPLQASLDFLFQTFSMEQIRRTHGDYSPRCNTLLYPGRQ